MPIEEGGITVFKSTGAILAQVLSEDLVIRHDGENFLLTTLITQRLGGAEYEYSAMEDVACAPKWTVFLELVEEIFG